MSWALNDYATEYYSKGFEAFNRVYFYWLNKKKRQIHLNPPATPKSAKSDTIDLFFGSIDDKIQLVLDQENIDRENFELEINAFRSKLRNEMFVENRVTTKLFWQKNPLEFPNLYEIAIISLNVQSYTAFIERFFSICGVVCTR